MPIMANQTKIPGWKLPGAIGWENWPDAVDPERENSQETIKPAQFMSATGRLSFGVGSFIVKEAPAVFEDIKEVVTEILWQKKEEPVPSPEAQKKQAEAAFAREQFQIQTADSNALQSRKAEELQETIQRISGGQMSVAEVVQAVGVKEVGTNHVVFLWNERLQKMEKAQNEKKDQEMAQAAQKPSLLGRLDAQEGQSLVANAVVGAG